MTKLKFYPKSHTYKVGKIKLTSVTQWTKKFFDKFDAKAVARTLAKVKKHKLEKKGVRYWLASFKAAAEHGTRIHNAIEDYINGNWEIPRFPEERDEKKFLEAVQYLRTKIDKTDALRAEHKVFDLDLLLAGTIDLMVEHEDGTVSLHDWKTNKRIKKYQRISSRTKMAQEPFNALPDCNHSTYSIQLSLYAYILERRGYKIRDLFIVHLMEDTHTQYKVDYEKIKPMIEAYFDERNKTTNTE